MLKHPTPNSIPSAVPSSVLLYQAADFIPNPGGYCSTVCAEARSPYPHAHDFYEIAYVMEGWGTHCLSDSSQRIKEGDYLLISPGVSHCIVSPAEPSIPRVRICNCLFTTPFFEQAVRHFLAASAMEQSALFDLLSASAPFCLILTDNDANSIRTLLRMIQYEMNQNDLLFSDGRRPVDTLAASPKSAAALPGAHAMIRNYLESFLIETGRIYDRCLKEDAAPGPGDRLIRELTDYIRSNLDLPLSLPALAARVHFSPEYLSRYFKYHTGQTISSYLFDLRMGKAEELLLHTAYPVSEIGYLCGYSSISNFRKYFTKKFGVSPREYRRQYIPASFAEKGDKNK